MESTKQSRSCTAILGSVTQAMRTQRALANAAIVSEVIKTDTTGRRGCVFGVEYSCAQAGNVRLILEKNGIRVREFRTGEYQ